MTGPPCPKISVIVLNYNGRHLLEECVEALL
jgi:GT2 family glycosyltransferase